MSGFVQLKKYKVIAKHIKLEDNHPALSSVSAKDSMRCFNDSCNQMTVVPVDALSAEWRRLLCIEEEAAKPSAKEELSKPPAVPAPSHASAPGTVLCACRGGCGFLGDLTHKQGYCSLCFKKFVKEPEPIVATPAAPEQISAVVEEKEEVLVSAAMAAEASGTPQPPPEIEEDNPKEEEEEEAFEPPREPYVHQGMLCIDVDGEKEGETVRVEICPIDSEVIPDFSDLLKSAQRKRVVKKPDVAAEAASHALLWSDVWRAKLLPHNRLQWDQLKKACPRFTPLQAAVEYFRFDLFQDLINNEYPLDARDPRTGLTIEEFLNQEELPEQYISAVKAAKALAASVVSDSDSDSGSGSDDGDDDDDDSPPPLVDADDEDKKASPAKERGALSFDPIQMMLTNMLPFLGSGLRDGDESGSGSSSRNSSRNVSQSTLPIKQYKPVPQVPMRDYVSVPSQAIAESVLSHPSRDQKDVQVYRQNEILCEAIPATPLSQISDGDFLVLRKDMTLPFPFGLNEVLVPWRKSAVAIALKEKHKREQQRLGRGYGTAKLYFKMDRMRDSGMTIQEFCAALRANFIVVPRHHTMIEALKVMNTIIVSQFKPVEV